MTQEPQVICLDLSIVKPRKRSTRCEDHTNLQEDRCTETQGREEAVYRRLCSECEVS